MRCLSLAGGKGRRHFRADADQMATGRAVSGAGRNAAQCDPQSRGIIRLPPERERKEVSGTEYDPIQFLKTNALWLSSAFVLAVMLLWIINCKIAKRTELFIMYLVMLFINVFLWVLVCIYLPYRFMG